MQVAIAMSVAGIWAAGGVPVAEKRRLAARAATAPVLAAAGRGPCPTVAKPDDIGNYELAMCEVRRGCGPSTSVAEAVGILQDRGAPEPASRLRKVSSRRNRQAHPDPGLPGDLGSFFSGRLAGCSGSEHSEASLSGTATRSADQVLSCASSGVGSPAGAAAAAKGTRGRGVHFRLEALEHRVRLLEHRLVQASQCDALDVWFADDKEVPSDGKVQSVTLDCPDEKLQSIIQELSDSGTVGGTVPELPAVEARTTELTAENEEHSGKHGNFLAVEARATELTAEIEEHSGKFGNLLAVEAHFTKELPALAPAEFAGSSAPLVEGVEDIAVEKEPVMSFCAASSSAGRGKLSRQRRARAARAAAAAEASAATVPVRPVRSWAEVNAELRCIMEERARKAFALRGIAPTSEDLEMDILRREIAFLEGG